MTRQRLALGLLCCSILGGVASAAFALDLPVRKAGLWELKMIRSGGQMPEMTMQHCTDETTDKDMNNMASPMAQQVCSKQDIQKTATGYVSDSVCSFGGMSTTSHAEITGDFNSAYTVKTTSKIQGGAAGAAAKDTAMTIEAKWLGACKADQKPGDIVMPGGMKMNVKDMAKLKNLIPGAKQ
ncbi:DUF3617 family protein [Bradyrhizobium sp. STM 3809]|uniref:DUF3617 domain-containing protein n=1 Tax=Bradyrhizobium sp. STM 3809 TaxID=551936 RepID=UPI000240A2AB|nr:DUF3617 family protein [Bradyrhizobium sp. STM 3809]CCE02348.1 conserved exported hypothetical protein [Bradyrhizobium sp. STM 3809]